jgi:AcrR family transcriptional regulator
MKKRSSERAPAPEVKALNHRTRVGRDRSARTRARIIEAAAHVFADRGADSPVIDDFIRAAAVARGTFYNHFRTTRELLEATITWLADDVMRSVDPEVDAIGDVALRLATALRMYLRWAAADRKWCAFVAKIPQVGVIAHRRVLRDLREGQRTRVFSFPHLDVAYDLAVGTGAQAIRRMAESPTGPDRSDGVVLVVLQGLGVKPDKVEEIMKASVPQGHRPIKSGSIFGAGTK